MQRKQPYGRAVSDKKQLNWLMYLRYRAWITRRTQKCAVLRITSKNRNARRTPKSKRQGKGYVRTILYLHQGNHVDGRAMLGAWHQSSSAINRFCSKKKAALAENALQIQIRSTAGANDGVVALRAIRPTAMRHIADVNFVHATDWNWPHSDACSAFSNDGLPAAICRLKSDCELPGPTP
jgi:hypothetical protein